MNKLRFLLLSFLVVGFTAANAQRQNMYFLKNNGQYVKLRDSADYLRIVKEPEQGSDLYIVNEHYLDGNNKSMGFSSRIDPPLYEGQYVSYYKNGKKKMVANYKKGKLIDTAYTYYPNGKPYTVVGYSVAADGTAEKYFQSVKDSTGKDLVLNGNGACGFYDSNFKMITESGNIKNGLYDGVWTGYEAKLKYKDTYANGKLISGESTDTDGSTYTYTKADILPQFKGGMEGFYRYLKKSIRYPEECYRAGIQGKPLLRFTVLKDGSLKDIRVMNSVHPLLAAEAIRVIKASPAWEAGVQRGRPVNVIYNVPVSFTLR